MLYVCALEASGIDSEIRATKKSVHFDARCLVIWYNYNYLC